MNWKIKSIKVKNDILVGEIVNVSFSVSDGNSTIESDTNLLPANSKSFAELKNITEEQVINWVKDALDHLVEKEYSNVDKFEKRVAQKTIESQSKQETVPLPWEV
jgi:NAD-dependent oxidoreductase involved in siderophore biosynthesis